MSNHEVELDQHGEAGRQVSALLSAALAAAQAAAQVSAQRARDTTRQADQQTRQAEQQTREQQRQAQQAEAAAQRQLERQQRTEQAVRHRQWGLKPTAQWLHDNPLSAAAAWASADVHRGDDPVAARHAEQWETVFKREGIDVDDVRTNAPAAVAAAEQEQGTAASPSSTTPEPVELAGELAAAEVATGAVVAGAVDVAAAEAAQHAHSAAGSSQWSAYADGAPAAALGGRGVSTPPSQVLAKARETPDLAATAPQGAARAVELVNSNGLDR
jgi:hypothetical protein